MKTHQEIFDTVAHHLLTQNAKSEIPYPNLKDMTLCRYRGDKGLKCAIGVLIPDELYKEEYENQTVSVLLLELHFPFHQIGIDISDSRTAVLLSRLQVVHDAYEVDVWSTQLLEIAQDYNLNTAVLGV